MFFLSQGITYKQHVTFTDDFLQCTYIFNKRSLQAIQYLPKVLLLQLNLEKQHAFCTVARLIFFFFLTVSICSRLFAALYINLVVHLHSNKIVWPKGNRHIVGIARKLLLNANAPLKFQDYVVHLDGYIFNKLNAIFIFGQSPSCLQCLWQYLFCSWYIVQLNSVYKEYQ